MFNKTKKASTTVDSVTGEVNIEVNAADGDNVAVSDGTHTLDINPDGSINIGNDLNFRSPTGPFKITAGTVTDTAANPLASALADRVSLSIRNKSATSTIYFGKTAGVTADNTATGGWEIGPGEDFHIDLDDTNTFFCITPTGESAVFKILEIASV